MQLTTKALRTLKGTKDGVDGVFEWVSGVIRLAANLELIFICNFLSPLRSAAEKLKPVLVFSLGDGRGGHMKLAVLILFLLPLFVQGQLSYSQGYAQYQSHQYDSAVVSFSQLIVAHPEKKEGYYNRGLCYYHLNKLAQALHDFNTCLQMDSVFDDARFMRVLILQGQGDWENAFIEFKKLNTNYAGYKELKKHSR